VISTHRGGPKLDHGLQLGARELLQSVVGRVAAVDRLREVELLLRALHHPLLGGAAGDEAVHVHGLGLAEPVNPGHRLQVALRVPVRVEEDGGVCGLAVDAETAGPCGHEEEEDGRARRVEGLQQKVQGRYREGTGKVQGRRASSAR
jgi:hypothetical protein